MEPGRPVEAYCTFCRGMCAHSLVDNNPLVLQCTRCGAGQTLAAPALMPASALTV